ncbi:MAG: phosphoribosylanthranilate isomerase [Bacteroidetes bacterium]|jgi:phosphoribosylanthranilate isomerase|nr:phosphoribosylanthranilate isomerase [Bacteroidota bacterium]
MRTKLKICGITDLADARYLAGEGVDYLGFVQHEDSPRYVVPSLVSDMLEWLYGPESVGVFVNKSAEEVNQIAATAGFDYVQLHGEESPETCRVIERPIIKAIRVRHDASSDQLRAIMERYDGLVEHFLLDTHNSSVWGGTGESFNWRLARELSTDYSIFLAGGIDAGNIERAVKTMRPFAIDLSSGVESAPGVKSFEKVDAFLDAFRAVNNELAGTDASEDADA